MSMFTDCQFINSTVVLDGNEYFQCLFKDSHVVVTRGNIVLKDSTFESCEFEFGGEAEVIKDLVLMLISSQPKPETESESKLHALG